jgi:hypothetical protein
MLHTPRAGHSRTANGGIWEDHKTASKPWPPPSGTRTGYSDFGEVDPHETTTYANHFGATFDGYDTQGFQKPNVSGVSREIRAVNGYGRSAHGGFFMREQLGDVKKYNHAESFRAMPSHARGIAEPTRPGPGYTRNHHGGYHRT